MVWERCEERERVQGWGVRARHNNALWGDCQLWSRPEVGPGPALETLSGSPPSRDRHSPIRLSRSPLTACHMPNCTMCPKSSSWCSTAVTGSCVDCCTVYRVEMQFIRSNDKVLTDRGTRPQGEKAGVLWFFIGLSFNQALSTSPQVPQRTEIVLPLGESISLPPPRLLHPPIARLTDPYCMPLFNVARAAHRTITVFYI